MAMRIGLAALVLVSCGGVDVMEPTACVVGDGWRVYGIEHFQANTRIDGQQATCATVAVAARYVVQELRRVAQYDARFVDPATVLRGMAVTVHDGTSWVDQWGRSVGGLAYVTAHHVEINSSTAWPATLTHEAAHIIQGGVSAPISDDGHGGWLDAGIYEAIDRVYATMRSTDAGE